MLHLTDSERQALAYALRECGGIREAGMSDHSLDMMETRADLAGDPTYAYSPENTAAYLDREEQRYQASLSRPKPCDPFYDLAAEVEKTGLLDTKEISFAADSVDEIGSETGTAHIQVARRADPAALRDALAVLATECAPQIHKSGMEWAALLAERAASESAWESAPPDPVTPPEPIAPQPPRRPPPPLPGGSYRPPPGMPF